MFTQWIISDYRHSKACTLHLLTRECVAKQQHGRSWFSVIVKLNCNFLLHDEEVCSQIWPYVDVYSGQNSIPWLIQHSRQSKIFHWQGELWLDVTDLDIWKLQKPGEKDLHCFKVCSKSNHDVFQMHCECKADFMSCDSKILGILFTHSPNGIRSDKTAAYSGG